MSSLPTRRQAIVSLAAAAAGAIVPTLGAQPQLPQRVAAPPSPTAGGKAGAAGRAVAFEPVSVPDYELLARERMTHPAWEYITSGCADDVTVRWNREALTRIRLESRVLVDVSKIDTHVKLLGHELPHPILLAPTAAHMLVHPEGERETARGADAASAIMVASTSANCSIAEVTSATKQPVWFQLYVQPDRGENRDIVDRAIAAGCKALCVTVDMPTSDNRDRVKHLGPFAANLPLGNLNRLGGPTFGASASARNREITWKDLEWFQSIAKVPVLLKGILHPADAEEAVKNGAAGIIVSNHGGRVLDTVPATIDALPRVIDRVAGRIPVLMDGGIRRGTDVLKALAFGANAVLIGRPYLYGLAVNGAEGVRHVVEILRTELEAAMALAGRTSIAAIDRSVLWPQ